MVESRVRRAVVDVLMLMSLALVALSPLFSLPAALLVPTGAYLLAWASVGRAMVPSLQAIRWRVGPRRRHQAGAGDTAEGMVGSGHSRICAHWSPSGWHGQGLRSGSTILGSGVPHDLP